MRNHMRKFLLLLSVCQSGSAFTPSLLRRSPFGAKLRTTRTNRLQSTLQDTEAQQQILPDKDDDLIDDGAKTQSEESAVVRAPLKYIGPYPCLALRFPNLSTSSQKKRNETGISLDFVLDTAANVNTINAQVASELDLEQVGEALPGYSAGGAMDGGHTYLLGDCELEGIGGSEEERFTFMTDLTASALPVASAAAAGLLSTSFFNCFSGVEFKFSNDDNHPPSVTFYGDDESVNNQLSKQNSETMIHAPIKQLPETLLPTVTLRINNIDIPALLDTGSPVTVLNAQAAKLANIETIVSASSLGKDKKKSNNPFAVFAHNFKEAQITAQAAARGDLLTIAGNGEMVQLLKSSSKHNVNIVGMQEGISTGNDDASSGSIGETNLYVGNLPGLAALGGLDDDSPPTAILGMDVLRLCSRLLYRGQTNEIYLLQ